MKLFRVRSISGLSSLLMILAMSAPAPAMAQRPAAYGVVTSPQYLDDDGEGPGLSRILELGVGSVRFDLWWKNVQPEQNGQFDFGFYDTKIQAALSNGIEVFVSLSTPPSWAAACEACVPYSMGQWYSFVRAVIERYGTSVTYGVWNEPNDTKFLKASPGEGDGPGPASRYVPLVQQALQARNDSVSGARFALGDTTVAAVSYWWWDFYYWHSIGVAMAPQDLLAVHWYPGSGSIHNYMQFFVDIGREVWLTETGALTPNSDQVQVENVNFLVDYFENRPSSLANWTRMFYYRLYDGQNNLEALVKGNWTPRPAFYTYKDRINAADPPREPPPATMAPGHTLYPGDSVWSPNGQFELKYQTDGHLVLYQGGTPLWWSGTDGSLPGIAIMQHDGNLVIYDGNQIPIFASDTSGNSNAYLVLTNEGKIRIYSVSGAVLWERPQ